MLIVHSVVVTTRRLDGHPLPAPTEVGSHAEIDDVPTPTHTHTRV